ncbi:MAG: LuxR C-terminal-related transcriptional regulator [Acidimicrobiia bacterium]
MATVLERARAAARQGSWAEALDLFGRLDPSELAPDDHEAMADAAWWSCRLDDSVAARQHAYVGYLAVDEPRRAAYAAWFLSVDYGIKGESAVGSGWLRRAQRHLAAHPDCVERGFLAVTESEIACATGDFELARARAERAVELGERCGSLDLHAMGIQTLGRVLLACGEAREGMALLDEAMTLVHAQRLSPLFTGWIYCNVVAACMERADLGRAGEWTEVAMTWCGSISDITPFHGICRMHRVEIAALRGEWEQAESEALRTVEEMQGLEQHVVAEALYAIGEIHLRRGHLPTAEDWFMRAHQLGRDPQPGLAMIRLAQGKLDAAKAALRLSLASTRELTYQHARLLAAQVDVSIAAEDVGTAGEAVEALERAASETPTTLLEATALTARASLHLASEQLEEALRYASRAWPLWQQLKLPYVAAKARMIIGLASKRGGDTERAQLELEAARAAFERLGATLDARAAAEQLGDAADLPRGLSARELEVLRLVAAGKTNREIAAAMIISEHTVSRHLQNIFRKLEVSSRAAATAFAFEHALV